MIPCIGTKGLSIFGATADQRLRLGESLFLATHLPILTNRFLANGKTENWTQENILNYFKQAATQPGNRVIILYGAAGSGKSELMAWLNLHLQQASGDTGTIVRISRTELDILSIVENFKVWLTGTYFSEITHQRWQEMRQKPRTFAKILVLRVLERLLSDDEIIQALYYGLLDYIEPRITEILNNLRSDNRYLDILSKEDFQAFQQATAIDMPFTYEALHYALTEELRLYLFEDLSLKETLAAISTNLAAQGKRPLLLVDDLVQSVNLFAAELLDYFITLDAGNWDVVLGLTPDAFTHNQHYQELYQRISYLDTFDDRVLKLWLSDETGGESYFLNEGNLQILTQSYLAAYRQLNGFSCAGCVAFKRCTQLQAADEPLLSPFNGNLLLRLFRSLPAGKGQVRHFIVLLGKLLAQATDISNLFEALELYASSQTAAEAENTLVANIARWYSPVASSDGTVSLDNQLLSFWGLEAANPLVRLQSMHQAALPLAPQPKDQPMNHNRVAVDGWLRSGTANRQLLIPLRKGMVKWLRNVTAGEYVYRHGIASPRRLLRYRHLELDTSPPVALEGVDNYQGLRLERSIGHGAFLFSDFNEAGKTTSNPIGQALVNDPRALALIWESAAFHHEKQFTLQAELGINLELLALYSYLLFSTLSDMPRLLNAIPEALWTEIQAVKPTTLPYFAKEVANLGALCDVSLQFFNDFYRLRRNLYDGFRIQTMLQGLTFITVLETLSTLALPAAALDYRLGEMEFTAFLNQCVTYAKKLHTYLTEPYAVSTLDIMREQLKQGESIALQDYSLADLHLLALHEPQLFRQLRLTLANDAASPILGIEPNI
jgi:hypothetical protein